MPEGPPDDRFVYLSDVLPTAWQAVAYADVPKGGTRRGARARADRRHGLPDRAASQGARVIGVDLVPERLDAGHGATASRSIDLDAQHDDVVAAVRDLTDGRGPDAVIDAVGMEAHGSPVGKLAQTMTGAAARRRWPRR